MQIAHKIRLEPNNKQITHFKKACGISRLAWNWGVVNWQKQFEEGKTPNGLALKKEFNTIKKKEFLLSMKLQSMPHNSHLFNFNRHMKGFLRKYQENLNLRKKAKALIVSILEAIKSQSIIIV